MARFKIGKWERLGLEALRNAIRLHLDSLLLHSAGSWQSAFVLSVLSQEELAKAFYLDDYIDGQLEWRRYGDDEDLAIVDMGRQRMFSRHRDKHDYLADWVLDRFEMRRYVKQKRARRRIDEDRQNATYVNLKKNGHISSPNAFPPSRALKQVRTLNRIFLRLSTLALKDYAYFPNHQMVHVLERSELRRKLLRAERTLRSRKGELPLVWVE